MVVSPRMIQATVWSGFTRGKVVVKTPEGLPCGLRDWLRAAVGEGGAGDQLRGQGSRRLGCP